MPKVPTFHSVNEHKKPEAERRHHDNSACAPGRDIPKNEQKLGAGGYRLCQNCIKETNQGH